LNDNKIKYIVIGGMAVIQHGYVRATEDIDLLVETSPENEKRLLQTLTYLPDKAVKELNFGDIGKYTVVRIADEIIIDLLQSAGGVKYNEAKEGIIYITIDSVKIPFAGLELLHKMKQTLREKDKLDLLFLEEKMKTKK